MPYPYDLKTKKVIGHYADTYPDPTTGEQIVRPREGFVYVTPYHSKITVFNAAEDGSNVELDLYEYQRQKVKMVDGYFEVEVLVTDQPGISPGADAENPGWTYKFENSWDAKNPAEIPITENLPETIDITDYFKHPANPGVIITRGDPGRGIESMTNQGNKVTTTYTDGSTHQFEIPIVDMEGVAIKFQYIHMQTNPASEWLVHHNLNRPISSVHVNLGTPGSSEYNDLFLCPWEEIDRNTIKIYVGDSYSITSGRAIVA